MKPATTKEMTFRTKEMKPKPRPPRTALQKREAQVARRRQPDYVAQEPTAVEDREAVYTGGHKSVNWGYTLADGTSGNMSRAVSKRFNSSS